MKDSTRNILLIVVLIAVAGSIWYLEKDKIHRTGSVGGGVVASSTSAVHSADYAANAKKYPPAKELVSPDGYINTEDGKPITLSDYIGKKVILLDFWTYSCINCQRTIPYLNEWYKKYKDQGFLIVGVHTPEFDFEKVKDNVAAGVAKFGIQYPVVMDSNYFTWDAYGNNYWPEEYLIDIDGLVREHNIGEGHYQETEANIQDLLAERAKTLGTTVNIPTSVVTMDESINTASPETYFNWSRNVNLGNGKPQTPGVQQFGRPDAINLNYLYLVGKWNIGSEFAENTANNDRIIFKYNAKHVYFVASSAEGVSVTVLRDGVPVTTERGADVDTHGQANIKQSRLYELISEPSQGTHTLEIIINGPKLDAYTFTFG